MAYRFKSGPDWRPKPYRYFSVKCLDQTTSKFLSVRIKKYFFDSYRFCTDFDLDQTNICKESVQIEKKFFLAVQTNYRQKSGFRLVQTLYRKISVRFRTPIWTRFKSVRHMPTSVGHFIIVEMKLKGFSNKQYIQLLLQYISIAWRFSHYIRRI